MAHYIWSPYTLTRLPSKQELRWLRTRKPLKTLLCSSCAGTLCSSSTNHCEQLRICLRHRKRFISHIVRITDSVTGREEIRTVREISFGVGFRDNPVPYVTQWKVIHATWRSSASLRSPEILTEDGGISAMASTRIQILALTLTN